MGIDGLQGHIEAQGLHWVAQETELSNLPLDDLRRVLGSGAEPPPGEPTLQDRQDMVEARLARLAGEAGAVAEAESVAGAPAPAAPPAPPASVDWRNVGGKNYVTPVEDQGTSGACAAFSTIAAFESCVQIARGNPDPPIDLSEADLWYCFGPGKNPGANWWPTLALPGIVAGVVDEACYPFTDTPQACGRCASGVPTKAVGWKTLKAVADMKQWLAQHGPVIAAIMLFQDFVQYKSGVYAPVRGPSNQWVGSHCICVIGYDDARSAWIVKNSWGTARWGTGGFGEIAYGACSIDSQMWGITGVAP